MNWTPAGFAMGEIEEVLERCNPLWDSMSPITWSAGVNPESSWKLWVRQTFGTTLLPHLAQVVDLAQRQQTKEIIAADVALREQLPEHLLGQSVRAGQGMLLRKVPRGERMISRLQDAVGRGEALGNFASFYAVRCGVFSITVRTAALSYAYQELVAGSGNALSSAKLLECAVAPINEFFRTVSDNSRQDLRFHG
jgi:UreF